MILRVPAVDRELVVLVEKEPLLLLPVPPPGAYENEPSAQLLPGEVEVELTGVQGRGGVGRVARLLRLPGAGVPHDDVAAAVLPGRDDALEVDVLDGVVLDLERRAPDGGVERRPLGHGPADQHVADLEAEVVVEAPG